MSSLFRLARAPPSPRNLPPRPLLLYDAHPYLGSPHPTRRFYGVACGDSFRPNLPPRQPTSPSRFCADAQRALPLCFLHLTEPFERLPNLLNLNALIIL